MSIVYTYNEWYEELRYMIYDLLKKVYPDADESKERRVIFPLLTKDAMYTWGLAFTSLSYDANDNYEQLELLGDRALKLAFTDYIVSIYPKITEAQYSSLESAYMSVEFQGVISNKLGFKDYIRVKNVEVSNKILTDVFEGFFGALRKLGDTYVGRGSGLLMCEDVVKYIFTNIEQIDMSKALGPTKTLVQQLFSRFKLGIPEERSYQNPNKGNAYLTTIKLTNDQFNFLIKHGIKITDPIIAKNVIGSTKTGSSNNAYARAYETLSNLGVTKEWSDTIKDEMDFANIDKELYSKALNKANKEGYKSFKVKTPGKLAQKNIVNMILQGVRSDGSTRNLKSITFDRNEVTYDKIKEDLLYNYLYDISVRRN